MNELINWVARNNTLMIQSGFTIVLLLVVIYIYRLFFVDSGTSAVSAADQSDVGQISQKIDLLLQQHKSEGALRMSSGTAEAGSNSADVDRLRAEINTLRSALNESEKKVFDMSPTAAIDPSAFEENNEAIEKMTEMKLKVEKLEARLEEYDIISEDIAELSQLRAENAEMKKKLASGGARTASASVDSALAASATTSPVEDIPEEEEFDAEAELAKLQADAEQTSEPIQTSTPFKEKPELEAALEKAIELQQIGNVSEDSSSSESAFVMKGTEEEPSELMITEASDEADTENVAPVTELEPIIAELNSDIPELEKNILNDFEKLVKKGSS